jgi:hypothetical protein
MCVALSGAPMFVTAGCVDPRYNDPYVDVDEQRTTPVLHRYIHGGFKGTDAKFSFYFPPTEHAVDAGAENLGRARVVVK